MVVLKREGMPGFAVAKIPCEDHNQLAAAVFHILDKRRYSFVAEGIILSAPHIVCLVDEQHAAHRPVEHGIHLGTRVPHILPFEIFGSHFDQLARREYAHRT